jgi:hypothetical protein
VRFKTPCAKGGQFFQKRAFLTLFFRKFPGFSGIRGISRGKITRKTGNLPPEFTPTILQTQAVPLRPPEKNRKKPPGFSGDFPGISRGLFSEKTRIFLDCRPVLPPCTLLRSARFGKNPQISGKVPGDFRNSRESPEKISRNSRKFRPSGFRGNFSGFSGISVGLHPFMENAYTMKR